MANPLPIDEKVVLGLASIGCTMKEIGAVVGCSVDTLERRFADVIEKGRESGKSSLRRMQWKAAEKGNVSMLIWLGKQILGQRDKSNEEIEIMAASQSQLPKQIADVVALVKQARGKSE